MYFPVTLYTEFLHIGKIMKKVYQVLLNNMSANGEANKALHTTLSYLASRDTPTLILKKYSNQIRN